MVDLTPKLNLADHPPTDPGRLIVTPHPILLDGQTNIVAEIVPGESLFDFLARNIDPSEPWEVRIGGVLVPREMWDRVKPKDQQIIEVRGAVNKQVLYIVALIALTYFTFGIGTAAGWGAGAAAGAFGGGLAGAVFAGAVFAAGSMLINKVLGPKIPGAGSQADPDAVYSLGAARNRARPYEPVSLLLGSLLITPDVLSNPYTWYQANDQYVGMQLNAGINVDRIDALSNGDTLLSVYDEVDTYFAGFAGMPEQAIPLHSNADMVAGAELNKDASWVQRTTSLDTVKIQVDIEFILGDVNRDGKPYTNRETIQSEYRAVGSPTWLAFNSVALSNNTYDLQRRSWARAVPQGQYDVRVRRLGQAFEEKNGKANFNWTSLVSIQADTADYSAFARIGVAAKATGQLNGPMDEIRGVGHAKSMPIWNGTAWVPATTRANGLSSPGAQILMLARGIKDPSGKLIVGLGYDDEQIDIPALQAFMLHCAANNYTYDAYLQSVRSIRELLDTIALAGFGQITDAGGKLSVTWAADEQPLGGVVNMATIKKGQFQVDYTLANAADGIEFTYFDRTTWQPRTLRVAAPGVTTMLNPATVQGEGITDEAHAAEMARYHLAQHLFQYKSISYSTDLEHLSYRRLSTLALQHDLTRWGQGGRVMGAVNNAGTVTLTLDEPVAELPTRFIGLRIPGEQVYRVFGVNAFVGETDTITLSEPWPVDAALPGDDPDNPAHDTIWIYDFKATPGYRVRVVDIQPESGLKGAAVSVVPEPPEFWTYVKTGAYEVPAANPLLPKLPTASNLKVTEEKVVQGDTTFTELHADFDVSGTMAYATVHAAIYVDGVPQELTQVAETRTRSAKFRIPSAGTYAIVVRPYTVDGIVGGVVSTTYTTIGAEIPPPVFDYFTVTELDGGVRKYAFGYGAETIQAPDFAGAEIRYITGNVPAPDWATMTPLGDDGFFTSAVEMVIPPAGLWTFACRPRNTSGQLGPATILVATLTENLGELATQTGQDVADALQAALDADAKAAQEIIDRQLADAQVLIDAALDATGKVQAEAQQRADDLLNERLAWEAAVSTETTQRQSADTSLAESISMVSAGSGEQFDSKQIWRFDTTVEGWTGNGTPTIVDGWLRPANVASSPYVQSPDSINIDGSAYRYVKLRIRKVGSPVWSGKLQWTTTTDNTFNATKQVTIPAPGFDSSGRATIDGSDIAWWPNTIRRVRLTLSVAQTASDYFLIDWVAIGRPTPGASVALVQSVEQASIDRDGAESLSRNTLAAQMRGTYEGTDAALVTQGLVWSERQARVTADGAATTRMDGMDTTIGGKASATELSQTKLQVTTNKDDIAASNVVIGQHTTSIAGKANQSALTTLDQQVNHSTTGLGTKASQTSLNSLTNTVAGKASQSALDVVSNKINSGSTGLDTKASQTSLTSLSQTVDGKASTTALNLLSGEIDVVAGVANANSLAVTQVKAMTGGTGVNLLPAEYSYIKPFGYLPPMYSAQVEVSRRNLITPVGGHAIMTTQTSAGLFSYIVLSPSIAIYNVPVEAGKTYIVSTYFESGVYKEIRIAVRFSDGTYGVALNEAGHVAGTMKRYSGTVTVPAGVTALNVLLYPNRSRTDTAAWTGWWGGTMVEEKKGDSSEPSTFSVGGGSQSIESAAITQSLTANVGPGGAYAQATTMVDVNGRITGTKLTATSTETDYAILADKFSIVSPGGGARTEYSGGNWRVYDAAGVLRVQMGVW